MGNRRLADFLYDSQAPSVTITERSELLSILPPGVYSLPDFVNAMQWKMEDARLAGTEEALPEEAHAILDTFNELYGKYFKICEGAKVFHPIKFTGNPKLHHRERYSCLENIGN